ncbi:hypothetical protein BX666DRAFT_117039 [Dichotomocladium elegans]|nr:hypothetical protein BX666DRAFT_117039 [Dichotomocladium elegans]
MSLMDNNIWVLMLSLIFVTRCPLLPLLSLIQIITSSLCQLQTKHHSSMTYHYSNSSNTATANTETRPQGN